MWPGPHPGPQKGLKPGPRPGPGPKPPGPPGPHGRGKEGVCKRDFWRFCAFRVPDMANMEDIIKCMGSHVDELFPPCAEMVKNATAALDGFHAACDASLNAQCPDAIGSTRPTAKCIVEHLADLEHGCLAEISKLMIMKMQHGRPGPHPPGPPPMEGFSTGLDDAEFGIGIDLFGPSEDMEWGPGREHGPHKLVAGMAGAFCQNMPVCRCLPCSGPVDDVL